MLQKFWAIVRRELIAYFSSPLAYIVWTAFLLLQGGIFFVILAFLSRPGTPTLLIFEFFFGKAIFFWFFLIVIPLITMRLIAEERRSGTIELLMTSPVTEAQVILGKTLAAWLFYLCLWAPTVVYPLLLSQHTKVDWGALASSYLGVALLGFMLVALGVYASTLSRNQIIAAVIGFTALIVLSIFPFLVGFLVSASPKAETVIKHVNLFDQMATYAKGVVDTRHVAYMLSTGVLFLFLATKSLELNKWR
jgi:ABC-2 type transport system permease protein